ncbi:nuclear transport factor 2 family protein [Catenovulum sp. SM1970]|uniref:YybH family protein n=1 Tax=Marinifaba aquimaris TaxID=2741323 RepID=UPI0015746F7E|nr:nuclear transport factor 2 family protein [Marinifaba aquimaris]NTS76553.1 nuclear transport factor 2 family protein [Marinifaba aquimaris]
MRYSLNKNRQFKLALISFVTLLIALIMPAKLFASETSKITQLINQSNLDYAHNVVKGDISDIQYRYTPDAWLIGHGGMRIQGREAITQHLNEVLVQRPVSVTVTTISLEKAGDKYIELGESRGTGQSGSTWLGHYMSIWVEKDGQWLIEKNIFN